MRSDVPGLDGLVRRIVSGELHGPAAFDAVVALLATHEARRGMTEQEVAQIRDEVVLGVSHDRELCALLFEERGPASMPRVEEPMFDEGLAAAEPMPQAPRIPRRPVVEEPLSAPPAPAVEQRPRARKAPAPQRQRRPPPPPKSRRPAPDLDDELGEFGSSQLRGRLLKGGAVLLVLAALAAGWYFTRSGPCDALVKDICLDASTKICEATSFRGAIDDKGISDATCQETRDAIRTALEGVPNPQRPMTFTKTLVEGLGFDPRGDQAPPLPTKKEDTGEEGDKKDKTPVPVIKDQAGVTSLFVDRSHLYWTRPNPAGVFRARNIGSTIETVGATPDPIDVTATRDYVYWVARAGPQSQVWVDPKRGTHEPAPLITAGFQPHRAAFLGADYVFVDAVTGAVVVAAVSGGPPRNLTAGGVPAPTLLAGDGATAYWATPAPTATLTAAVLDGSTPPQVVAQGVNDPRALLVDASGVYWIEGASGSVLRIAAGTNEIQTLAAQQPGPADLALDDETVYWSNAGDGTVMALPKAGGEPTTIAGGQEGVGFLVVDGAAIYWVAGANIVRVPK